MRTHATFIFTLILSVGLATCGTLPPQVERPYSGALAPAADSPLTRITHELAPDPSTSGFRLMPLGLYSLDARIELIQRARSSLDVQYYLISDDRSGRLFMRNLRDAALRGVRVRLLVDDLNTAGADALFSGLAAFPNVEVRLFNPFCCGRQSPVARFATSLGDLRRLNRRMHNKLFIADSAIAVMGGRNIADEYFARAGNNFVDMDVLLVGEVVGRLGGIFDEYWNSPQAYAISTITGGTSDEDARAAFRHLVDEGDQMHAVRVPPLDMLDQRPLAVELEAGHLSLAWGRAVAFADRPAKVTATSAEMARAMSVQMNVMDRAALATRRLAISSPYFVPGDAGVKAFADLTKRGVEVSILTNSLAANDVPLTHIGYSRYRAALLRHGIELYELRPASVERRTSDGIPGSSLGRLHAKVAVFDEASVYIGSMNLDPRSESANTELGIIIQSPEFARDVARVIDATRTHSAYRVRLRADGKTLEWVVMGDARDSVLADEPEAPLLLRFRNWLLGPFLPEQLL